MAKITIEEIFLLQGQGLTQAEIARRAGVTRQYIYKLLRESGYRSEFALQTRLIRNNFPWELENNEVMDNTVYIQLWLAARFNHNPASISKTSTERVRALIRKLVRFHQVIDYDPHYPWVKGLFNTRGLAFLPRSLTDENYMIKIRPGITLTEVGKTLWQMPDLKKLRL
ncbi:helix-turn-helix domain-containing protein [Corynebacterium pyruviciproducens]